jgi:ABC-type multidrug transport system fused ATPase/permease subunit
MSHGLNIADKAAKLQSQLETQMGFKGRDLAQALRRAGRRLPRRVRAQIQTITEAQKFGGNPKLERRLNAGQVEADFDAATAYLAAVDRADLRRGRILALVGVVAFNLIVIVVAFVTWLWWRGYV